MSKPRGQRPPHRLTTITNSRATRGFPLVDALTMSNGVWIMGIFRVTLDVTRREEIEVYAPDQEVAIDKAVSESEARAKVRKVRFVDIEAGGCKTTLQEKMVSITKVFNLHSVTPSGAHLLSDGMKLFSENGGKWFLDYILANQSEKIDARGQLWLYTRNGDKLADVRGRYVTGELFCEESLKSPSFPLDSLAVFFEDGVFVLASEHQ